MATIYLVRHGQASFGHENYDQLSPLGEKQSRLLGEVMGLLNEPTDLLSGSLVRHQQTAAAWCEGASCSLSTGEDTGFNEFDHLNVIQTYRPEWADAKRMASDLAKAEVPRKAFHQAFKAAVVRWVSGQYDHEYNESWPVFQQRVVDAFQRCLQQMERGSTRMVFTSGGPIAVICGHLLGLNVEHTFKLNNVLVNTGLTQVITGSGRASLSYFNNYSHLERKDPAWVTYR